jgi:hypothetical protein
MGEAKMRRVTADGILMGCSYEFVAMYSDHISRRGAPAGISGSFTWMVNNKIGVAPVFKLVGVDYSDDFRSSRGHAVNSASPVVASKILRPVSRVPCENELSYCAIYDLEESMTFWDSAAGAAVIFNRRPGGMDVNIALPKLSAEQHNEMAHCMLSVADRAEQLLGKR